MLLPGKRHWAWGAWLPRSGLHCPVLYWPCLHVLEPTRCLPLWSFVLDVASGGTLLIHTLYLNLSPCSYGFPEALSPETPAAPLFCIPFPRIMFPYSTYIYYQVPSLEPKLPEDRDLVSSLFLLFIESEMHIFPQISNQKIWIYLIIGNVSWFNW